MEKDGAKETLDVSTNVKALIKASKEVRRYMKEGWRLVEVSGSNAVLVDYMRRQIDAYNQDPQHYQVQARDVLATTKNMTGASAKALSKTAGRLVRRKILAAVKREKHHCSRCGRVRNVQAMPEGHKFAFLCKWCLKELEKKTGSDSIG